MKEFGIVFSYQPQVYLGLPNVVVPEICGKVRQCGHDVALLFLQLLHAPHGKGVSQVMDPGTISASLMLNAAMPQRLPEPVVDGMGVVEVTPCVRKEIVLMIERIVVSKGYSVEIVFRSVITELCKMKV